MRLAPLYQRNKTLASGLTCWECTQRRSGDGCKGRIVTAPDDTFLRIAIDHTHPPTPEKIEVLRKGSKYFNYPYTGFAARNTCADAQLRNLKAGHTNLHCCSRTQLPPQVRGFFFTTTKGKTGFFYLEPSGQLTTKVNAAIGLWMGHLKLPLDSSSNLIVYLALMKAGI